MAVTLRLALWNAKGLSSHRLELQTFLDMQKIDIALISENHFTSRTVFRLPRYAVFTQYTLMIPRKKARRL
jgi:hypothetical protein